MEKVKSALKLVLRRIPLILIISSAAFSFIVVLVEHFCDYVNPSLIIWAIIIFSTGGLLFGSNILIKEHQTNKIINGKFGDTVRIDPIAYERLMGSYEDYKSGKYDFKSYTNETEIESDIFQGKSFVLPFNIEKKMRVNWIIFLFIGLTVNILIGILWSPLISALILIANPFYLIALLFYLLGCNLKGIFTVVGPEGILHCTPSSIILIPWNEIEKIYLDFHLRVKRRSIIELHIVFHGKIPSKAINIRRFSLEEFNGDKKMLLVLFRRYLKFMQY
jgi:hypothetical protein